MKHATDAPEGDQAFLTLNDPGGRPTAVIVPVQAFVRMYELIAKPGENAPRASSGPDSQLLPVFSPPDEALMRQLAKSFRAIRASAPVDTDENARDAAVLKKSIASDDPAARLPGDVVFAVLADQENPIRVMRRHRKLTQKQLAEAVGLSAGYLGHLEAGRRSPSSKTRHALARALGCDAYFLDVPPPGKN